MQLTLKSGKNIEVRYALPSDAGSILDYTDAVSEESENLTFGKGEFNMTYEQEVAFIEKNQASDNSMVLIAIDEETVVSVVTVSGKQRPRVHHFADLGITVRKTHWGLGLGRAMLETTIKLLKEDHVVKQLHLEVRTDNYKAIALYESMGFIKEGTIKRAMRIVEDSTGKESFYDVHSMGKALEG